MSAFQSPLISPAEIVENLKSMNINMTENDLKTPSPKRWMDIYSGIYNVMTSGTIEDAIQQFCCNGEFKVQHRELFAEAFSQMGFTICMQRVLFSCGYTDFKVQDVIEPTRKRVMKIMSSVINKLRHDTQSQGTFQAIQERCEQSKEEHDKIMHLNKELKQQRRKMVENDERNRKQILELSEEWERLKSQVTEYERQADPEKRITDELKILVSEKNALKEKLRMEKSDAQQEIEQLSQKIVSCPASFKQEQDRLKKRVIELKELNDVKLEKLAAEKSVNEQTSTNKNASEKAFRLAKEVLSDFEKVNEALAELDQCNEKVQDLQDKQAALYAEYDDVNENLVVRQGQKRTFSQQVDVKKQCGQQHKEDLRRNHEMYQDKLDRIRSLWDQIKLKVSESKKAALLVDDEYENVKREWNEELSELYKEIDILHNRFADACKQVQVIFQEE